PLVPINLFNITWRRPAGRVSYDVLPLELTGVPAQIVVLYGRDFPTGSHKVGAAYAVLLERLLAGDAIPGKTICIWPSTGNYGIGGAWVGGRMGFRSIVVMPQGMSAERFELIRRYGAEIRTGPGGEADVVSLYDIAMELFRQDPEHMRVLNQFDSMANYRFHYYVTGNTIAELVTELAADGLGDGRAAAYVSAMGSAGTIAAGDRLKQIWPEIRVVGVEPIQCPTLSCCGYGSHAIQGIGDRHITWIHNVFNTDAVVAIDDQEALQGLQLLTDPAGWRTMIDRYGVPEEGLARIATYVGISGIANILAAIKACKFYELSADDVVVTVCTDTVERYRSTLAALREQQGPMDEIEAAVRLVSIFHKQKLDWVTEGTLERRRAWHNFKFFTWVEKRGKRLAELEAQRSPSYWQEQQALVAEIDRQLLALRVSQPQF
ncbi:MAG: pyridoxal-phosphate dependent enzyme, partial [Chloroflexi bacterium]|nr:pyridoxal-phosphate dependent enzyme [Chloroflexota bacterium]